MEVREGTVKSDWAPGAPHHQTPSIQADKETHSTEQFNLQFYSSTDNLGSNARTRKKNSPDPSHILLYHKETTSNILLNSIPFPNTVPQDDQICYSLWLEAENPILFPSNSVGEDDWEPNFCGNIVIAFQ